VALDSCEAEPVGRIEPGDNGAEPGAGGGEVALDSCGTEPVGGMEPGDDGADRVVLKWQ
jgi:hypothetical protein